MHKDEKTTDKDWSFINVVTIINLIVTTFICSIPPIWLIMRILNNNTKELLVGAIITIITVGYMIFSWCSFFYNIKIYRLEFHIEELEKGYEIKP